ncbi:hypothetical protein FJTKL_02450 [Diaporthe vaccinii]|uniref:Peptide hydrolase n=1 Tax=Diaporthe vaccinii TaxID=105482 RepID=A0ABR4DYH4_9PEZI
MPTNQQRPALLENDQVLYEAPLVDANTSAGFVPTYFGFSANANISGSYVFCNFGSPEDFEALAENNVSLAGEMGIIKLGTATPCVREQNLSLSRALSVHNAEQAGMIGVVLYTDPGNDGSVAEANGYKPFPDGPARPLKAIERGGFGSISKDLGDRWQEGGLGFYGVNYNVGPSPPELHLHIINHADIRASEIHNGPGAGDPGSGSAALNEVVRSFGAALQQGWQPERTIVFASFEGEEFLQIGSLLWVTKHVDWLRSSAVAYLNVVVAASGSHFHAKASPLLYSTLLSVTDSVLSPNQSSPGQTVRDVWGGKMDPAGSGDANRFMSIPCVSTIDFGFTPALLEPAFPYHTGFDNFEWMDQVGDPGWKYHVTSAKIWSLLAAHLVKPKVLNVSVTDYALAIHGWLGELHDRGLWSPKVNLKVMTDAVERLHEAASRFDGFAGSLEQSPRCAWWTFWVGCGQDSAISDVNKV